MVLEFASKGNYYRNGSSLGSLQKKPTIGVLTNMKDGYGVGLWKTIRKEWDGCKSRTCFVEGNGRSVKFQKDVWCGFIALNVSFSHFLPSLLQKRFKYWRIFH